MFIVIFYFFQSVSHNSSDTKTDKDHDKGGGEDRGTTEDPNINIAYPIMVLDIDI